MKTKNANARLIIGRNVESVQGATLEVVRIKLSDYAKSALGVRVSETSPRGLGDLGWRLDNSVKKS